MTLGLIAGLGLSSSLMLGCKEASGNDATVANPAAGTAAASAGQAPSNAFQVVARPVGSYKAGQAGAFEVELTAGPGFKVNQEYPLKFKVEPCEGVEFPQPTVGKEGARLEKSHAVVTVPVQPKTSGSKVLKGRLSFSVCTPEQCLVDKQDISLPVDVVQ